jgi:hypothetical protein
MVRVGSSRRVHPRLEPYLFTATTSATNSKAPAAVSRIRLPLNPHCGIPVLSEY